jgi:hypothetical protein
MRTFFLVLSAGALLGAAACGGKVVVDGKPQLTGGASGTSTASSTSGVGGSTSPSASSGPGVEDPLCFELCNAELKQGCAGSDCFVRCASTLAAAPECLDAAKAAASCIEDHVAGTPTCAILICADEMSTYVACTSAPSCSKALVGGNGVNPDCIGKGVCGGGTDEWIASCQGNGQCECLLNSSVIGSCQETGPFLCDFLHGCCSAFFPPGP